MRSNLNRILFHRKQPKIDSALNRNRWNKALHRRPVSRPGTCPVFPNTKAILTVLALLIAANPAFLSGQVQWDTNGRFLAFTGTSSIHASAAVDDSGGFFFAYEDNQTGDNDIRCQWVDGSGTRRWGESGVQRKWRWRLCISPVSNPASPRDRRWSWTGDWARVCQGYGS